MGSKRCKTCKETKYIWHFNKDSSRKDGFSIECRECQKERNRVSYKPLVHREKHLKKKYGLSLKDYSDECIKRNNC